jgi:hypothetical protein
MLLVDQKVSAVYATVSEEGLDVFVADSGQLHWGHPDAGVRARHEDTLGRGPG